jgi:hypothetical protein
MDQFLKDGNLKMDSQEIIIKNEKLNLFFFKKGGRDCIKIENKNKQAYFYISPIVSVFKAIGCSFLEIEIFEKEIKNLIEENRIKRD